MVYPKGRGLFCQATTDIILKHLNCPFYLPIGFTIANGDVVVYNAQPFIELCKAAHNIGAIGCLDIAWLAPMGNQFIIQELDGALAV